MHYNILLLSITGIKKEERDLYQSEKHIREKESQRDINDG